MSYGWGRQNREFRLRPAMTQLGHVDRHINATVTPPGTAEVRCMPGWKVTMRHGL